MADDITLTVRVRDLSRGDLNRLNQQMNRLQRDFNRSNLTARNASNGFRGLGEDINRLNTQMRQMTSSGRMTARQMQQMNNDLRLVTDGLRRARNEGTITGDRFRSMSRDVTLLRARFILLGREGNVFTRLAARTTLLQQRLRDANTHAHGLRRSLGRIGDMGLGGLIPTLRGFATLASLMGKVGDSMKKNKRIALILVAALLLLGSVAQIVGALLVTALGAAFIALGAYALRADKDIKSAFGRMKGTIGATVKSAAQPIREHLIAAMDKVGAGARKMEPQLAAAFRATAPLIDDVAGAFGDFGRSALPGMLAALRGAQPVMNGFRQAMSLIGDGFGEMFRIMTQGEAGEALGQVWSDLGYELRGFLVSIGEFISTAAQSGTATMIMVGFFRTLNTVLNLVAGALKALDPLFDIVAAGFRKLDIDGAFKDAPKAFDPTSKSLKALQGELKATDAEIKKIKAAREALGDLPGPAKESFLKNHGATDDDLAAAMGRRKDILDAIADAEEKAAEATRSHADSVSRLTERLQGLADLNRNYLDAQSAQNEAINKAKEDMGGYSDALKMVHGQVDLTNTSAQEAYKLLSDVAKATSESTKKAMEANAPWEQIRGNWASSYKELVNMADGMGLSKENAQELINTILGAPPTKEMWIKARVEQAQQDIQGVISAFEEAPDEHTITVDTLTADAEAVLRDFGFKITRLPDGKTEVTTDADNSLATLRNLNNAMNAIDGRIVNTYVNHNVTTFFREVRESGGTNQSAKNQYELEQKGLLASGGLVPRYATGGGVQAGPSGLISGPGSGTSDSIFAAFASGAVGRISNTEFVVNAASTKKYLPLLEAINKNRLKLGSFAKGGKVSKAALAEREARNEASSSFIISHFGKMAGYKNTGFERELGLAESLGDIVSALNKWRSVILKATHGGVEKNLLKQLDKAGKSLINYSKKLAKTEKSLESAKNRLNDLKQAAASLRESVTNGVLSSTNITQAAGGDKLLTMADIMNQMRAGADKSSAFANAIKQLKAKGVNGTTIKQIAEAGIDGGGLETATALLGASGSEIETLNQLQKQINTSAKDAGKTTADIMYGAGIKAAEGLVKGLIKKKKDIESAMMIIAKAMEKSIKKALKIKSPSKVMQDVGQFTAEGFALGVERNRRVDHAWESMLTTRPTGTTQGGGTVSRSGDQYVIPIYIGNKQVDEIWLDTARRVVRTRGGNVQNVLGRR
jgi:hypothetical protein